MKPEQMIHRLRDMGRYWDDGLPQPDECADLMEEMYEALKEALEAIAWHNAGGFEGTDGKPIWGRIQEVLAKAEDRS